MNFSKTRRRLAPVLFFTCLLLQPDSPLSSFTGQLLAQSSATSGGGDAFYQARWHPVLRNHFRATSIEMLAHRDAYGRIQYPLTPIFLEHHVDQMTEHFLGEVKEKMQTLARRFGAARLAQMQALEPRAHERNLGEILARWEQSLKDVRKEAGDLRGMLHFVFTDLEGKSRYRPEITGDPVRADFRTEMEFIAREIETARQRILGSISAKGDHTLSVRELQEGNMLVCLERVEKMSKKLRKALSAVARRSN